MIPTNLDEAVWWLYNNTAEMLQKEIVNGRVDVVDLHLSEGRELRNDWGLWGESVLKDYFNSIGIFHPDDMTDLIFKKFISELRGDIFNLKEEVEYYEEYWRRASGELGI